MSEALEKLKARLAEVHHLGMAAAVLDWDQQTYMPPGGVTARANQKATLSKLSHELFTDDRTASLLAAAEEENRGLPEDSDDAALLRVARRDFDKATRIPADLVEEKSRVTSLAQEAWAKARAENDFPAFAPWLERVVELERRTAEALGYEDRLYDALVDLYEPGMTSRKLDAVFSELKRETVPLVQAISENQSAVDDSVLHREYDEEAQRRFAEAVLADCGFDFTRGRQDRSVHPFCTHFSQNDVRLTTRYDRNFLSMALFGSLHEMGHGLYEQGFRRAWKARCSPVGPRWASTKASPGCGKIWSAAAGASGSTTIPGCSKPSRMRSGASPARPSIVRSIAPALP
jgi:carboxypeptidase Taq